jgi:hypothetical protein
MSELQAALLAMGLGVVIAVYAFGWYKQRQYHRKFGAAFGQSHDDALYQINDNPSVAQPEHEIEPLTLNDDVLVNRDALPDEPSEALPTDAAGAETAMLQPVMAAAAATGEPCAVLDNRCDYIIEMHLTEPDSAAVLDGLWRHTFHKPLQVCGLAVSTGQWERVNAGSQTLYSRFRIALQLLDRGGVISLAELGEFRELLLGMEQSNHAELAIPDMQEAYRTAQSLDTLCAEVDQMVGINLLPQGDRRLNGDKISQAAAVQGMKLEPDGAFHFRNAEGHSLMTLINQDARPFQPHALEQFTTPGITLMLDVPRVENPAASFDLMVHKAHALARALQVNLVDDHRVQLTDAGLARIRMQIDGVEAKMRANSLVPGSVQARRLFS